MQSMKCKKGFEMQFNWIFILIAGVLILGFFTMIAQKQLMISEKKQEINTLKQFDNVFSSALQSEETIMSINTRANIMFFCTENQCSFKINEIIQKYKLPVFAPYFLDGGPLTLWAKSFKAPFQVTNLLLITNPKIKFVIISSPNEPLKEYLEQTLPDSMEYEFLESANDYKPEGYDHVRFVMINTPERLSSLDPSKSSELRVEQDKLFLENKMYPFSNNHKELFLAAMFSQNRLMYETQLKNRVLSRVKDISKVLKMKAMKETCYTSLSIFDDLSNAAKVLSEQLTVQNLKNLERFENKIEKSQLNCPRLY